MALPQFITVSLSTHDGLQTFLNEVNEQLRERGCLGNADAIEMSFDCCVMDAAAKLKAEVEFVGREYILVAMDGAPIEHARNQIGASA